MSCLYEGADDGRIGLGANPIYDMDSVCHGFTFRYLMDVCTASEDITEYLKINSTNPEKALENMLKVTFDRIMKEQKEYALENLKICMKGMTKELAEHYDIRLEPLPTYNGKTVHDLKSLFEDLGGWDNVEVGTYVSKDVADDIVNALPPACWRKDCIQLGEPHDEKYGKPTYLTLRHIKERVYQFCGYCHCGENIEPQFT